jgi:outer membrane protein
MTKRISFIILLMGVCLLFPLSGTAQYKYGFLSYKQVFQAMPEYTQAQTAMKELQAKYEAEAKHNEEGFHRMFADYLQGQKDFPLNIMLKRQKELQEAMEKGIAFRNEAQKLLEQAEKELYAPVYSKLDSAIRMVGLEKGYEFIMNTDDRTFPFIHQGCGEDITVQVKAALLTIKEE